MIKECLNAREAELIDMVGAEVSASQRELSRRLNLSLGMTNLMLRRLIDRGYIETKPLSRRRVEYVLTSRGAAERFQKSVSTARQTIRAVAAIQAALRGILADLYDQGHREFLLLGGPEYAAVIRTILQEAAFAGSALRVIRELPAGETSGMILICDEGEHVGPGDQDCRLDLIAAVARRMN